MESLITDYTIPSDNRELQLKTLVYTLLTDYTIPSDNRELQHTITAQVLRRIIPYQVITGNYNLPDLQALPPHIIPYQVITGNYNVGTVIRN